MRLGIGTLGAIVGLALATTCASRAQSIIYTASGTNGATGTALAGQATLTLNGGVLSIDLQNTSAPAKANSDALMALIFTLAPGKSLSPLSASLMPGSAFTNSPDHSLGQEWGYAAGFSGPDGTNAGVSASGLGLFSSGNFAAGGQNLNGFDYGLVNGIASNANNPTKQAILVNNGIHLELAAPNLALSDIDTVRFQYGTALSEPRLPGTPNTPPGVPEPGTLGLLATAGLSALPFLRKRAR